MPKPMNRHGNDKVFARWCAMATVGFLLVITIGDALAQEGAETSAAEVPDLEHSEVVEVEETNHPALEEAIGAILSDGELQRTTIGIHVEDLASGEVLYSRNGDELMNPASNVKLVTAAVVLHTLGPQHTFSTELSTRQNSQGRIDNLYVKGEGEAFLLFKDVLSWAADLRLQGIETIDGDLVIDDGAFEEAYLPPGFEMRDVDASYRSPIGAVSINFNAVSITVEPADQIGGEPNIKISPPNDYITVENRANTTSGSLPRVNVSALPQEGGTRVVVTGSIGVGADPITQRKRIDDPPAFAGAVVAEAMKMMGIGFEGSVRRGRAPENGDRLLTHESEPVANTVAAMNKWSNNFIAEQLLRVLGGLDDQASTWDQARLRVQEALDHHGIANGTYSLINGSGLYDGNELSPRQIVHLLRVMKSHQYGPEFVASLPIAGVDGTLRHRLGGDETKERMRAKTGTLRDVTALSGYSETASGRTVAYSIIFNDPPRRAWNFRSHQDSIARAIAGFDGGESLSAETD